MTDLKRNLTRFILAFSLGMVTLTLTAQMPYAVFKEKFRPHNKNLIDKKNEGVQAAEGMDAKTLALYLESFINGNEKQVFANIICSINRNHAGSVLDNMEPSRVVRGLNWLTEEWALEVIWYMSESTYNTVAPYIPAITNYKGGKGAIYEHVKPFQPIYASLGYQLGYSGYRGINKWVEAYNGSPVKTGPLNTDVILTTEMPKLRIVKGFSLATGFYISDELIIDVNFSRRGTKSEAVFDDGDFTRSIRYTGNHLGVSMMRYNRIGNWDMYQGGGMSLTFSSLSAGLSIDQVKGDWEKIDSYFNVGVDWRVSFHRQLIPNLPVMFMFTPSLTFNLLRNNFEELNTRIPNIFSEEEIKKMKSGVSVLGFEVGAAYNLRSKKKEEPLMEFIVEYDPYVNTIFEELNPIISPDGKTLYYSRNNDPRNTFGSDDSQDIWVADVSNGIENAKADHMKAPFNKLKYNYMAGISPDENTIMISGSFVNGVNQGKGYSLIHRTKTGWSDPQMMVIEGYTDLCKGDYSGAFLSNDGQHLVMYFSKVSGESETYDLYVSHRKEDNTWTRPASLGNLNTDNNELSPYLASDGTTLYFSSDRSGGQGSNDIYITRRLDDTWNNWSEPVNMGAEVNTPKWDAYYTIDAQGKFAYMVSYKNQGKSGDIIRIPLKHEVQPEPVVLVKGRVLNAKTNEPLEASVTYDDLTKGSQNGIARTNPATGEYKIVLPYGAEYSFLGEAKNFVAQSNNIDLTTKGEYMEIEKDIYLYPIEVGSTVRLSNIFFETGKAALDMKSRNELDRLVDLMKENPNLEIEISGHTDNVGAADFNKKLSGDRAASVVNYLVEKGIDKSRLVAKGYGMEKPVADNGTDEGKAFNRRVEFTITKN